MWTCDECDKCDECDERKISADFFNSTFVYHENSKVLSVNAWLSLVLQTAAEWINCKNSRSSSLNARFWIELISWPSEHIQHRDFNQKKEVQPIPTSRWLFAVFFSTFIQATLLRIHFWIIIITNISTYYLLLNYYQMMKKKNWTVSNAK